MAANIAAARLAAVAQDLETAAATGALDAASGCLPRLHAALTEARAAAARLVEQRSPRPLESRRPAADEPNRTSGT
jgi:hypothetical protein